jgi:hypothetical protein
MVKEDFQIDIDRVESRFNEELEELDIYVTEREIGNGPEFAIEAYEEGSSTQIHMSNWYNKKEFEAFCAGMKEVTDLFHEAAKLEKE